MDSRNHHKVLQGGTFNIFIAIGIYVFYAFIVTLIEEPLESLLEYIM
jgi:hypothetical protein